MQKNTPQPSVFLFTFLALIAALLTAAPQSEAADTKSPAPTNAVPPAPTPAKASPPKTLEATEADKAWIEVEKASRQPAYPPEWQKKAPTEEEQRKFFLPLMLTAADKAKDFYTKYPKEAMAATAKRREYEMISMAVESGATNQLARLDTLEKGRLADPKLTDDERFQMRQKAVERAAGSKEAEGITAMLAELEKGARVLQKDFPKRPEVMEMLLQVATNSEGEKARNLLKEIIDGTSIPQVKDTAKALLKKMEAVGKPVSLKFTAVDGREVDVTKLKDKVVLVDFWATWCGPCVAALPDVKAAYEKNHGKGFEIVGISLDQSKEKLQKFVGDKKMEWPQYFDGLGWTNKLARQFEVESIPAMWLVDKKGILRDINARVDLNGKIAKLLAE